MIEILRSCGLNEACVTDTTRTVNEQVGAIVAYYKQNGAVAAKKLYGHGPGGNAIGIYEAKIGRNSEDEIVRMMATAIDERLKAERSSGGQRHLMHTSDTHYVFDIAPSSIFRKTAFVHAVCIHPEVTRFLHPESNPPDKAYHIEILK